MDDRRLLSFTRSLNDAVRSGLPLARTLAGLAPLHGQGLESAAADVSRGKPLHEALAPLGTFPPLLIALIRAGEESGKLDAFLERYAALLDARIDFRRRLGRALAYPAFAAAVAAAVLIGLSAKAVPALLQPLIDAGVALPEETFRTVRAAQWTLDHWLWIAGGLLAAWAAGGALAGSSPGRKARALAGHWLPGARYLAEEARAGGFAASAGLLLQAGLRPRQSLEILAEQLRDDPVLSRRLARGAESLTAGGSWTDGLGPCLPAPDRPRLAVAERSGRLDEALATLAREHRDLHLHRLKLAGVVIQFSAAAALAPLGFAVIMGVIRPALGALGQAGALAEAAGAPAPAPSPAAAPPSGAMETPFGPVQTEETARFNEVNARRIVEFMQASGSPAAQDGDRGPEEPAPAAASKPVPRPKLKPASSFRKPSLSPVRAGSIKSGLD